MRAAVASTTGGILSYFTRHRTAANLVLVIMLAVGIAALPRMRAQFFPDIVADTVAVNLTWEGAGADDVDLAMVQLLEPALLAVEGVVSSSATSREGGGSIALEFETNWDMARASDEVQAAVDVVTDLPDGAEDPEVRRGAWRDPVTDVVISGPVEVGQLGRFADEFVTRLFAEGVTRASIRGIAAPETLVEVTSAELIKNDITMAQVAEAIRSEATTDPAGDVSGNERVRTGVAKRSVDQIGTITLRTNADGSKLTIADIATVTVGGADRERAYFVGDSPAISVRVDRSNRGDAIGIQKSVEEVAEALELTLPEGVTIELIRTRSEAITGRLNLLIDNGLVGLGLVVSLLFLFLNARTAFWVAAGIPVAMLGAIALMYTVGLTINMISLFALIITLGIVVDDAIVIGEHADYRARTLGEPPEVAAEKAAQRMSLPVFSATLTTIIAFFGLVAVGGRFGSLIKDIPFTVIVVLIASLIECFLILPNHMFHALKSSTRERWYDWPSRTVTKGFNWFRRTLFRPFIAGVIWARYPVLALAVVILTSQMALFIKGDVTWRFFNAPERGSVSGNFAMLPGATREDTFEMMRELQRATNETAAKFEAEYGASPLDYVLSEVGGTTGRGLAGSDSKEPDQLGSIAIELIDADLRPEYSSFRFVGELQDAVRRHPMLETVSFRGVRSGPGGDSLDVEFYGADADTLKGASEALQTALTEFGEVSAVEDTLAYDKEELILDLTPQGQALGFTIDQLGTVLRNRLNGIEAATYPDGPRSATIRVELPSGELSADFLDRTFMRTELGEYLPLADIVTVSSRTGFSTVRRENGVRVVSVTGDISEDDSARADEITDRIAEVILPKIEQDFGVASRMSGLAEQEQDFLSDAGLGFLLCMLGIFLVLAWVFSSWTRPLVIMSIIPFGLVGTIYGHHAWGVPLSMFTVIGLIGMTGIIINDSIVLVSTIDEYAEERGLIPAIIDGTVDRLRPVLLTTLTTVLGLAPLLFESSSQAQFLKPTVITLCYGLGFGFFLVLLVVPSLIAVQADMARQTTALKRAIGDSQARTQRGFILLFATIIAGLFVSTLGAVIVTGTLPTFVTDILPVFADATPPSFMTDTFPMISAVTPLDAALIIFIASTAGLLLTAWLVAATCHLFDRKAVT
ncbi:MAG: efflux RND transporter permease subunit [Litoreibacter sp.]